MLLYISTGVTEIEEGEVEGHKIRLLSHTVGRMSFGAEPKVLKVQYKKHCTCYITLRDFKFSLNWNNRLLESSVGKFSFASQANTRQVLKENQTVSQINRMFPGTPSY